METVDQYINDFPEEVQKILTEIRKTIQREVPEAVESIAYMMPAYKLNGKPLIYFAGYKKHIGLYATPSGHSHFEKELSGYKQGKGSVQFPLDAPIPYALIAKIAAFNAERLRSKK